VRVTCLWVHIHACIAMLFFIMQKIRVTEKSDRDQFTYVTLLLC